MTKAVLCTLLAWFVFAAPARPLAPVVSVPPAGKVFLTVEEALELVFPKAEVKRGRVYLTAEQKKRASKLAKVPIEQGIVRPYVARDAKGKLLGTAYLDVHRVRTLKETLLIVVDPEQRVRRIEILSFGEPLDYLPRGNWYAQFTGKRLDDKLTLKGGIRGVTGATLTARATTEAVRRVLALHQVLNSKDPEKGEEKKRKGTGGDEVP